MTKNLQLKFDGANNSTNIVDSAQNYTFTGDIVISTDDSKFGGSSLLVDGSKTVTSVQNDVILEGDFTVEFWIKVLAHGNGTIISNDKAFRSGGPNGRMYWGIGTNTGANNKLCFWRHYQGLIFNSSVALNIGQWQHVALTRSSNNIRMFVDGVNVGSYSSGEAYDSSGLVIGSGWNGTGSSFYMDELRIIPGYARYTSNFSAPYLLNGTETTLNPNGSGFWNNELYVNGSVNNSYTGVVDGYYYISGTPTTLDISGSGSWNGDIYINGTINNSYTGWVSNVNKYYIDGVETTLNSVGTGSYQDIFYIEGEQALTLDSEGNGDWNGQHYCYGNVLYTGWDSFLDIYYFEGQQTTLDEGGRGTVDGKYYINGSIANGWDWDQWSGYYIDGVSATLNPEGFGTWNGIFYAGGSPNANYTGPDWWDYVFYLNSQLTTLDINGNGEWNGQTYVNGVVQGGGGIKNGWVDGVYYINDVATTLNSDGHGTWNGKVYYNGSIRNGYDAMADMITQQWGGYYYIDGVATTLDNQGNGEWNGQTYVNGVVQGGGIKNGWITDTYWINDVATTLDQNGNGTWVGKLYENGSLFSGSKYSLTFVNGVAQAEQIVTVIGSNIPVAFGLNEAEEPLVELVFASITSAGETVIEQIIPTVLPTGYTVAETVLAYSIDTTATFEGSINVDFILPSNTSQTVFDRVKCFHVKNSGAIEEMTRVSSDFSTKRITVAITSFSDFLFLDQPQVNKSVKVIGKSKFFGKIKFA